MIETITIGFISLASLWLLWETKWLTIRLLVGALPSPKVASYEVYQGLRLRSYATPFRTSKNGLPIYQILLSPGIADILCGWNWLEKHCADLVNYQPKVWMQIGGVKYDMTIKQPSIIKDIMKVNRLTKAQKLAYA